MYKSHGRGVIGGTHTLERRSPEDLNLFEAGALSGVGRILIGVDYVYVSETVADAPVSSGCGFTQAVSTAATANEKKAIAGLVVPARTPDTGERSSVLPRSGEIRLEPGGRSLSEDADRPYQDYAGEHDVGRPNSAALA